MSQHIGSTRRLVGRDWVEARVYEGCQPTSIHANAHNYYYFCCETCGACGLHKLSSEAAFDEAVDHVNTAPAHQEANNG